MTAVYTKRLGDLETRPGLGLLLIQRAPNISSEACTIIVCNVWKYGHKGFQLMLLLGL